MGGNRDLTSSVGHSSPLSPESTVQESQPPGKEQGQKGEREAPLCTRCLLMVEQCHDVTLISCISWESVNMGFGPDTRDEPLGLMRSVCPSQVFRPLLPRQEPARPPPRAPHGRRGGSAAVGGGVAGRRWGGGSRKPLTEQVKGEQKPGPCSAMKPHLPGTLRPSTDIGQHPCLGRGDIPFLSFLRWREGQGFTLLFFKRN